MSRILAVHSVINSFNGLQTADYTGSFCYQCDSPVTQPTHVAADVADGCHDDPIVKGEVDTLWICRRCLTKEGWTIPPAN